MVGEEDAHDALQEMFANACQSIVSFRQEAKLSTWLYRIVVNCCLAKLRKKSTIMEVAVDMEAPEFLADGRRVDPRPAWTDDHESDELRKVMQRCIDELPVDFRLIVLLRDVEGYSISETSQKLEISESLVKVRLHRARQALREKPEPFIYGTKYA